MNNRTIAQNRSCRDCAGAGITDQGDDCPTCEGSMIETVELSVSDDVAALADTVNLLDATKNKLVHEPMAVYTIVAHAAMYANERLGRILRGEVSR